MGTNNLSLFLLPRLFCCGCPKVQAYACALVAGGWKEVGGRGGGGGEYRTIDKIAKKGRVGGCWEPNKWQREMRGGG